MNVTNLSMLVSIVFIILFLTLSINLYGNIKESQIKNSYKTKIEYALSSSMLSKYDYTNDPINTSKISIGLTNEINYEKMFNTFKKILYRNFNLYENDGLNILDYLDKYIVMKNEGIIVNYKTTDNNRIWSDIIPYTINYRNENYVFTLDDKEKIIDNIDLKNKAIINTLRRNMIIENNNSILFNIPYEDGIYNSVYNQSVFATFKDVPIINNKNINIAVLGGNEIKNKNIYYINRNDRYEKINYSELKDITNNIDEEIIFEDKKEAGKYFYPEI